jgi:hypothetical protein
MFILGMNTDFFIIDWEKKLFHHKTPTRKKQTNNQTKSMQRAGDKRKRPLSPDKKLRKGISKSAKRQHGDIVSFVAKGVKGALKYFRDYISEPSLPCIVIGFKSTCGHCVNFLGGTLIDMLSAPQAQNVISKHSKDIFPVLEQIASSSSRQFHSPTEGEMQLADFLVTLKHQDKLISPVFVVDMVYVADKALPGLEPQSHVPFIICRNGNAKGKWAAFKDQRTLANMEAFFLKCQNMSQKSKKTRRGKRNSSSFASDSASASVSDSASDSDSDSNIESSDDSAREEEEDSLMETPRKVARTNRKGGKRGIKSGARKGKEEEKEEKEETETTRVADGKINTHEIMELFSVEVAKDIFVKDAKLLPPKKQISPELHMYSDEANAAASVVMLWDAADVTLRYPGEDTFNIALSSVHLEPQELKQWFQVPSAEQWNGVSNLLYSMIEIIGKSQLMDTEHKIFSKETKFFYIENTQQLQSGSGSNAYFWRIECLRLLATCRQEYFGARTYMDADNLQYLKEESVPDYFRDIKILPATSFPMIIIPGKITLAGFDCFLFLRGLYFEACLNKYNAKWEEAENVKIKQSIHMFYISLRLLLKAIETDLPPNYQPLQNPYIGMSPQEHAQKVELFTQLVSWHAWVVGIRGSCPHTTALAARIWDILEFKDSYIPLFERHKIRIGPDDETLLTTLLGDIYDPYKKKGLVDQETAAAPKPIRRHPPHPPPLHPLWKTRNKVIKWHKVSTRKARKRMMMMIITGTRTRMMMMMMMRPPNKRKRQFSACDNMPF